MTCICYKDQKLNGKFLEGPEESSFMLIGEFFQYCIHIVFHMKKKTGKKKLRESLCNVCHCLLLLKQIFIKLYFYTVSRWKVMAILQSK